MNLVYPRFLHPNSLEEAVGSKKITSLSCSSPVNVSSSEPCNHIFAFQNCCVTILHSIRKVSSRNFLLSINEEALYLEDSVSEGEIIGT